MPTLTFDENAAEPVLEQFGWEVADDPEGLVVDETGDPVKSLNGHQLTVHHLAGIVADKDGNPVPLVDSFPDLCSYVAWKREVERGGSLAD